MQHRTGILAGIVACVLATAVAAAPPAAKTPKRTAAADSTAVKSRATKATAPRKDTVRTLDAIRIEGEIDVPQVLFITARETRRFRDGTRANYQITASDVAKSIPSPTRLRIVAPE